MDSARIEVMETRTKWTIILISYQINCINCIRRIKNRVCNKRKFNNVLALEGKKYIIIIKPDSRNFFDFLYVLKPQYKQSLRYLSTSCDLLYSIYFCLFSEWTKLFHECIKFEKKYGRGESRLIHISRRCVIIISSQFSSHSDIPFDRRLPG